MGIGKFYIAESEPYMPSPILVRHQTKGRHRALLFQKSVWQRYDKQAVVKAWLWEPGGAGEWR